MSNLNQGGQYNTLGRPTSLPVGKQTYQRSTSDPDLTGSNPSSPDCEVASLIGQYKGSSPKLHVVGSERVVA